MRIPLIIILLNALVPGFASAQADGEPDAEQIIRSAITRRAEVRRTTSLGAGFSTVSLITVNSDSSKIAIPRSQEIAHESVGIFYRDPLLGTRLRVIAQRQTLMASGPVRNIIENFQSIGRYFSIDDREIVLLNTAIPSPLAEDAFQYYSFEVASRIREGRGEDVYTIGFRPISKLYPGFEGTINVSGSHYDVAWIELIPSQSTTIPFVDSLHLKQTFSPVDGGAYQPETIVVNGVGEVGAVAFGIAEPRVTFSFQSNLTNRHTNVTIPDSIRMQSETIAVNTDADSLPTEYWKGRSRLTDEQVQAIEESQRVNAKRPFSYSLLPVIDYNRAGGATLGASGSFTMNPGAWLRPPPLGVEQVTVGGMAGYSFGLKRPIAEAWVTETFGKDADLHGTIRAGAFSQIATTTTGDKSYPRIMNTLVSATLHQDYYNFYRKDGWSFGGDLAFDPLRLAVTFENSRQFSIGNNDRWALLTWKGKEFQPNPPITDGEYETWQADLSWGRVAPFLKITPVSDIDLRWSLTGLIGKRTDSSTDFRLAEALVSVSFPVARTGYSPMTLALLGAAGTGTATLPPQYQFRLRTSAASFGKPGGFVSPPKGLYGGTEYLALGAELNTTDLWWRAIGLPTYNGRGVELILAGGSARYRQRHATGYVGTGDEWYSEVGIAFSRIPLFITDLIAGRVDLRWGLGSLGRFGGNFTFVVPF